MKTAIPLLALLLASCAAAPQASAPLATAATAAQRSADPIDPQAEDRRLMEFLDRAFDEVAARSPQTLTGLGIKQRYGELDDYTDEGATQRHMVGEANLAVMKSRFDPAKLSPAGRLSYRLFEENVAASREALKWRWHGFPVSTNGSAAGSLPVFLINQHRVDSVADAEAYISRIRAVERVMGEIRTNLREAAKRGIVPPKLNFAPVRSVAKGIITGAPFPGGKGDNVVLADFTKKVNALTAPPEVKQRLIGEARAALTGPFRRGYDTFLAALDEIEPQAKGNNGAWSLPGGAEYYASNLRRMTTTSFTADEIHQTGLAEVARIQAEMEKIKDRVGFKGTLQQFFAHIKNGQQFKYSNTDAGRQQYLNDAIAFVDQAMAAAPRYFHRLPKAKLEVRAVEPFRQATAPVAFYNSPAPDGSRPGIYYVNLADMNQVLKPQNEGISYHEGAPGHHFHLARQQELEGVPKFRRFGGYGAYSEGWGLYAERLAKEMGFYQDPYSEFGHLSLELWRAVRLVTDTGLHHKRWTREQAIKYFQDNSLLSEADIVREVERYINWPGQATTYKVGQLKIFDLRARAQRELGSRFDIRDFHEVILGSGAVPLDVLEERINAYIAEKKA